MKRMIKLLSIIILFFAFTAHVTAQDKHHKKERKEMMKQLDLSKQQKKEMNAFHRSLEQEQKAIENNSALTADEKKAQIKALRERKHDKLQNILPEQKEKMKAYKTETPHRGVTNMPNERKAK